MGAFVSIPECKTHYNVTLDCSVLDDSGREITFNGTWPANVTIGGYTRGQFPPDPDIAGVGILGVFLAVTSFALAASIVAVLWQMAKTVKWTSQGEKGEEGEEGEAEDKRRVSFTDILETLVMACSDQQLFTGAAYALTLRYLRGCTVSAYHYNIIANMLLLTCATHMMSVIIVRNYWKYPWLAQNATEKRFPTGVPDADQIDSLIFLPAACFQSAADTAAATFQDSVRNPNAFFIQTIGRSTPDNKIQGWNVYVLTLLYYGAAIIAEAVRFVRRARGRPGWRGSLNRRIGRTCAMGTVQRKFVSYFFLLYLFGGVGISSTDVVLAGHYIFQLRTWVDRSGWVATINGLNPENDATTFGQLVPILTSALVLFSFAQVISEKFTRNRTFKHRDEEAPELGETIQYLDPSHYDLLSPPPKTGGKYPVDKKKKSSTGYFGAAGVHAISSANSNSESNPSPEYNQQPDPPQQSSSSPSSTPPRIELEHQDSWGSSLSMPLTMSGLSPPNVTKPKPSATASTSGSIEAEEIEAEAEGAPDENTGGKNQKQKPKKQTTAYAPIPTEPEPEPEQPSTPQQQSAQQQSRRVSPRTSSRSLTGSRSLSHFR